MSPPRLIRAQRAKGTIVSRKPALIMETVEQLEEVWYPGPWVPWVTKSDLDGSKDSAITASLSSRTVLRKSHVALVQMGLSVSPSRICRRAAGVWCNETVP